MQAINLPHLLGPPLPRPRSTPVTPHASVQISSEQLPLNATRRWLGFTEEKEGAQCAPSVLR